jgi:hypothetical protein
VRSLINAVVFLPSSFFLDPLIYRIYQKQHVYCNDVAELRLKNCLLKCSTMLHDLLCKLVMSSFDDVSAELN